MADPMQRAREFLAAEFPPGDPRRSALIRGGTALDLQYGLAIRAIAAALRAAPEGFVMVPVELTSDMNEAGEQEFDMGNDFADAWEAAIETMLAARPQGVR